MKYLIYDIQHMPLWLSGTLVLLYVALFAYFVYIIVHYGRKHNCFLLPIVMVGLGLSACTSVTDTPVVAPVSTMQLTVNGLSYDINLATTDTVNLRALSVEFPAQFSVANHSRFANLTIGGKPVVGGTCSLQIDTISHRHHIELCYTLDGNLLCSFRHISSVLKIDRQGKTGDILWRVAGADNDGGYAFHGQHYARYHAADGTITLFNNGNDTSRTQMLRLAVDVNSGAVSQSTILLNDGYYAQACGALSFSGDNMIVGWGIPGENEANNRLLTEYDAVGNAIFTITLPTAKSQLNGVLATYRCVKCQ